MSRDDGKRSGQGGFEKNCKTQSKHYHNPPIRKLFHNVTRADVRCQVALQVPMTEFISSIKWFVCIFCGNLEIKVGLKGRADSRYSGLRGRPRYKRCQFG